MFQPPLHAAPALHAVAHAAILAQVTVVQVAATLVVAQTVQAAANAAQIAISVIMAKHGSHNVTKAQTNTWSWK